MISVAVVYRNYIPLNSPYCSFWLEPPASVKFEIPKPKNYLRPLYHVYRVLGGNPVVSHLVRLGQSLFFTGDEKAGARADLLFYVGMLPTKIPEQPFFIDIEHVFSLLNFSKEVGAAREEVLRVLTHKNCAGIVPISEAARRTLESYLGADYEAIRSKTHVVYPALPVYRKRFAGRVDHSMISDDPERFDLLFVGKDALRKGLQEVLPAFLELSVRHSHVHLTVVADTPGDFVEKFRHPRVRFFSPKYSADEIMTKFFLPADVFVMPTHADTFGMVFMEALACGKPVVATRQFAIPEIIEDGVNGLLLDHPPLFLDRPGLPNERSGKDYNLGDAESKCLKDDLVVKLERVISNPSLLRDLSAATGRAFEPGGKFSVATRNAQLEGLFRGAVGG